MADDDKLIDRDGNVDEEELDRRIRDLGLDESPAEQAKEKVERIDDDFELRLRQLEDRAAKHRVIREGKKQEETRKRVNDAESAKGLGVGLSLAYTIIGTPIIGIAIGWLIDLQTGTQNYRSIGAIAGMILGIFAAIVIFNKSNRQG
jgi:F0F1-type ATP synthase assembly protein I